MNERSRGPFVSGANPRQCWWRGLCPGADWARLAAPPALPMPQTPTRLELPAHQLPPLKGPTFRLPGPRSCAWGQSQGRPLCLFPETFGGVGKGTGYEKHRCLGLSPESELLTRSPFRSHQSPRREPQMPACHSWLCPRLCPQANLFSVPQCPVYKMGVSYLPRNGFCK